MKRLLLAFSWVLLGACGNPDSSERVSSTAPPPKPKDTVFDPMVQQLDRARQAAQALPKERKDNLDTAIDSDSK